MIIIITLIILITRTSESKDDYNIGLILPLTGDGSIFGQSYLKGAQIALNDIDLINGRAINLFAEDNKFDGTESINAANFLLNIKNVDTIVTLFHAPASSISSVVMNKSIPFIYEAYTVSILDENPYAFKSAFDAYSGCKKLMLYANENNEYENIGFLMSQTEYNQICLDAMREVESNINEYVYTFGDTDFKTILTKMKNENIDTLMTIMIDFEYIALFKQLVELDYQVNIMCATASECINPQVQDNISSDFLENSFGVDFIPPNIKTSIFGEKYLKKYPNTSSVELNYAVTGYEMINYVSEALKSCEPRDNTCLVQSLKDVKDYESAIESSGFKDRVLQVNNIIYSYKNGEWQLAE